jgi:hypothetical protein
MPIDASPSGTLDIENATLRSRDIVALTNMVAGNDVVRSGGPALEVYGDPGPRLELVSNTAATDGTATFTRLESNVGVFSIQSGTDASDNGTITFGGFANERMRIDADGNVGIGTTNPTGKLELFSTELDKTHIRVYADTDVVTQDRIFELSDVNGSGLLQMGDRFNNDSTTYKIQLNTEGDSFVNGGNVGIGKTDPQYKLDVGNGGGDVMLRVMNSASTSGKLIFGRSGTTEIRSHAIESYNSSGSQNNYMKFLVHDGTGDAPYETRTEVMTLRGDGNVGIGTTNPSSQLELYGAGKDLTFKYDTGITRRSAATRDGYYSGLENSIKRVGDRNIFDGSSFTPDTTHEILFGFSDTYSQYSGLDQYYPSYNEMRFKLWSPSSSTVGSLTDVMTLRGDGNVGIGSTSPGALLDLYGPKDAAAFKFKITDDTSNLTFRLGMKAGTSGYTDGWTTIDPNGSTSTGIAIFDALYVQGTLSVSSTKNFLIDHPLQPTAKKLVHAAVESPRVDLIYRGTTQLKDGRAIVNIDRQCVGDESCAMEDGTFEALCRDPVYYLQNTTDFNRLIGTIDKNLLTIISEDVNSIAIVNWMVVAERKDRDILESSQTNDNGRLNTEIIESSERVNRDGSVRYPST